MKAKIFLRISSGLLIFHLLGHTFGTYAWKESTDPTRGVVVRQMTENKFPFMGAERSMGDSMDGYGWAMSIALLLIASILWFASGALSQNASFVRKLVIAISICLFMWSLDEFIFFFPLAAFTTLLAALFALLASVALRNQKT